jgi:hypothetical protein
MTKARDISKLLSTANGKIAGSNLDVSFENIEDTGTEGTKVATGTTAERGSTTGQLRFNSTTGKFETYNGTAFASFLSAPSIDSVSPTEIDSNSGSTTDIVITGSNFVSGANAKAIGNDGTEVTPSTVTFDSSSQLTATFTDSDFDNTKEPYDIKVTNPDSLNATIDNQINIDSSPTWTTAAGSVGTIYDDEASSLSVAATDADGDTIAYSLQSGSLPTNITLNTSTGALEGTPPDLGVGQSSTYNFTVRATANTKTVDRAFSVIYSDAPLDGSSQARANTSASAIKTLTSTTTNGLYWIKPSGYTGSAFQVYCNMNIDGGIMLMMKFNSGSTTFGYNSSYWTNNSLYNDGTPNITVDDDYKYIAARDLPISYLYVTESTMTNGYKYTLGTTVTGIHNIWAGTNTSISPTSAIGNGVSDNGQVFSMDTNYANVYIGSNSSWSKNPSATSNGQWTGRARFGLAAAYDYGPWESVRGEAMGLGLQSQDHDSGTGYRSSVHDQLMWCK